MLVCNLLLIVLAWFIYLGIKWLTDEPFTTHTFMVLPVLIAGYVFGWYERGQTADTSK